MYHDRKQSYFDDLLHNKKIEQGYYNYLVRESNMVYNAAIGDVKTITNKMTVGYVQWVTEFQALIGQLQISFLTASEINSSGIGDLLNYVNAPGMNGKVFIWRTNDGLIVLVKGGVSDQQVLNDINNYISTNGLSGNTAVTMLGYKDGAAAAQQAILDLENTNQPFHFTNLVVVGAQLQDNLPSTLNTFVYNQPTKEEVEKEKTYFGLKADQIGIPIAAVVIGLMTDGEGDLALLPVLGGASKDIGVEYGLAYAWNQAAERVKVLSNEKQPMQPPISIWISIDGKSPPVPINPALETQLINGIQDPNLPDLSKARIYFRTDPAHPSLIPAEPGANMTNLTNNSYLEGQNLPDPGSSDTLPHGGALPVGN